MSLCFTGCRRNLTTSAIVTPPAELLDQPAILFCPVFEPGLCTLQDIYNFVDLFRVGRFFVGDDPGGPGAGSSQADGAADDVDDYSEGKDNKK